MKIHIPILLLNLERSQERRLYMEKQLNKLGLEFEIFKAVDGRNLTSSDLKQYSKKEALREVGRELSPGEIGCALSHAKIWQHMIEKKYQEILVLEDDIILGGGID